jgi:hypothetical protein
MTTTTHDITRFAGKCAGCGEVIEFEWDWSDGVIDFGADVDTGLMYTSVKHADGPASDCAKQWTEVYEVKDDDNDDYTQL